MGQARPGTLFLHYPCFDGLASAAIAWEYLERHQEWSIDEVRFVNYDARDKWLQTTMSPLSAVVDFLFHPDAKFWADHHGTTFLNHEAERSFDERRDGSAMWFYNRSEPSCAGLLWKALGSTLFDQPNLETLAYWANRIDAAVYESVDEAIFGRGNPAAEINLSLSIDADESYGIFLLRCMRKMALQDVVTLADVKMRVGDVRRKTALGLAFVRDHIRLLNDDIAVADFTPPKDMTVSRYSPYSVFPNARYSLSLTRHETIAKITAMRNPWRDFESVDLGEIFSRHGGGGHRRVGSVVLRDGDAATASERLSRIVQEIQVVDRRQRVAQALPA